MTANSNINKPFTVGRIISTGWKLYTDNFSQFVLISLRAAVWMFVPFLVAVVAIWWIVNQDIELNSLLGLIALLIPAWIVFYLFCAANSLGESAGVSRLTYQQLALQRSTQASESLSDGVADEMTVTDSLTAGVSAPEAPDQALRFTRSRKFSLLGSAAIRLIVSSIISFIGIFLFALCAGVMIASAGYAPQAGGGDIDMGLFLVGLLLAFAVVIASTCINIFVSMRMTIAEQSLAIEQDSGAIDSIGRSWKLMKKNVLKAFASMFLAVLIALPISLVLSFLTRGVSSSIFDIEGTLASTTPGDFPVLMFAGLYFVNLLLGTLVNIIVMPFFKTVLTTIYFDVRSRKERVEV